MWNLENGTDEPVCSTEIETQKQRKNLWIPRGESSGGWGWWCDDLRDWIDMYALMCIKRMTNKNLLYKKIKLKKT